MIIFNQVYKEEKGVKLKNLTFNIKRGDFVFIYDQDRDTLELLRKLMSGAASPDRGIIRWLNGYNFSSSVVKGEIGVVFRENILLPSRSIEENLRFIMEVRGLSRDYFIPRVNKLLNMVDLLECRNSKPGELLLHQLIRANIAQAMLNYPAILILEDPTVGLDEVNSQAIFRLLEKVNALSITVLLLSSDRKLVHRNHKRLIKLERGEMIEFYA